ncbi:LLM class flavin-dependent oxidoreductase [Corticibacter populi]|uniref:LLM class flavin-dependent oxidoreductase n=1 Tax=Corticibacter populi TaxID=1550736 RepID=A0A3M6R0F0_9BURK|nr:LLM class flavin-dependent oxidoreductase [Corticibacter populi]RMX08681.1 LLM class flavin-dependent oxidoreductase [Corticibacter populi]RZS36023.1 FMN-dependent oxidoreductase (nitrilotriacetate monooxygenase family) [Corticibacter populi]
MSEAPRQLTLNLFIYPNGHHEAAWRHPLAARERILDVRYYQSLAQQAEAAKFDAVFFADGLGIGDGIRYASRFHLEPLTLINALAAATEKIGFIATASTSFYDPYTLARLFGATDHWSGGRIGWNIVTSSLKSAAGNYGLTRHPSHAERYERAHEFVQAVTRLWDSWEDEAFVNDASTGLFADTDRIHAANFTGKHLRVQGALNLPRSPQGRPVYVQAGSSEDGRQFAAQYAEAIFTAHQTLESAQSFYRDVKQRAAQWGRNPAHIKILPGLSPFIGSTEAEARALQREFDELIQTDFSLLQLKNQLGLDIDLRGQDLDAPFPRHLIPHSADQQEHSRFQLVLDIVDREKPTLRQLIERLAGARGHFVLAGTPEQIADHIETWFTQGAADGINVMPPWLPGGLEVFTREVVPILQRRGLFRQDYSGDTLRDHLGLPRPPSLFASEQQQAA